MKNKKILCIVLLAMSFIYVFCVFKINVSADEISDGNIVIQELKGVISDEYSVPKIYILYFLALLVSISAVVNYVLIINISKRKKSEKLLRESEEQYRKLFEVSPDAIIVDKDGIIKFANESSLKLFGVNSYEDIVDRSLNDFVPPDMRDEFLKTRIKIQEEDCKSVLREAKVLRKDGKIIEVEAISTPFPYKGENMILTVKRDITDSKRLSEAIESDKLKTEFFSNISHELRTPLNVILSALQLWELYEKKEFNKNKIKSNYRYIDIMKQNCYRLLRLISNLIDITKVDSNYVHPNFQKHDIVKIVEDITLSVAAYVENKNVNLIFDTDMEEKVILCDPDKIERIFLNLLSNAVKFTNSGDSIFVNISNREDKVIISVKDTGVGIPSDKLELIFERFKQVDKSLSRNNEGSGIGLSLVKAFVEMHEGRVYAKSDYGKGSEFIVELPVNRIQDAECEDYYEGSTSENYVERVNIEFSDIYK